MWKSFAAADAPSTGLSAFERLVVPGAPGTAASITYQPGLDGLRGLAVGVVVLFHLGVGGFGGGFLAVSLFFTLSGVLIGTLLLAEIVSTGRFDIRRFWLGRARWLLPAALTVLAVLSVSRPLTDALSGTSGGDISAAAVDVANWHFLLSGLSYADMFTGPSAVLHFWSLAIEEQFYIVVAVVAVVVARRAPDRCARWASSPGRGRRVVPAAGGGRRPRAADGYRPRDYGTDTRAGELLIGVVIAAVLVDASRRRRLLAHGRAAATLGVAGLLGTLALWALATPGSPALRQGLLPLTAICSSLLVIGAMVPSGPVGALSGAGALRRLGRISYGVYLIHWPVIVVADQLTADRSVRRDLAIVVVTLGLAQLSATILERPVRRGRFALRQAGAAAAVAPRRSPLPRRSEDGGTASAGLLADLQRHAQRGARSDRDGRPAGRGSAPPRPVRRLGGALSAARPRLVAGAPALRAAPSDVHIGCGIALSPSEPPDEPHACDDPAARYALKAIAGRVDVAVMMSCQWELVTQTLPGDDHPRTIGDPVFDDAVRTGYLDAVDGLVAAGVSRVLWIECPHMSRTVGADARSARPCSTAAARSGWTASMRSSARSPPLGRRSRWCRSVLGWSVASTTPRCDPTARTSSSVPTRRRPTS